MCLIAEVEIESPLLADARAAAPEMSLSFQQETLPSDGPARFFFWARGGDFDEFETGLGTDPSIAEYVTVGSVTNRRMYRVDVSPSTAKRLTYPIAVDNDILFLDGHTRDGRTWQIRLQCPDRPALIEYREGCRERGVPFRLRSLFADGESRESDLTAVQREVLEVALVEGYFNIPRDATAGELGDELDISTQSVSERLRRALSKVVERTLTDGPSDVGRLDDAVTAYGE